MYRILTASLIWLFSAVAAMAASTVNPNVPGQQTTLSSGPVRSNFLAAYNDINNILGVFAGVNPPNAPTNLQSWADTSTSPNYVFKLWNGQTNQWVPYGSLNVNTGVWSPYGSSSSFAASSPLFVNVSGGIATYGLSFDSNFAVTAGRLALSDVPSGSMIANCSGAAAEPTSCSWSNLLDRNVGNTNGFLPYRSSGSWGSVSTGTSGHVLPFLDALNTWSAAQTVYTGGGSLSTALTGTLIRAVNVDGTSTLFEAGSYGAAGGFSCVRSSGTISTKIALSSGDQICGFSSHGYDGTAFSQTSASIRMFAAQNWTSTAHGSNIRMSTTTNDTVIMTERIGVENDGGIVIPPTVTGGSKGAGSINASTIFLNGDALGTAATKNVGTSGTNVPMLNTANTWGAVQTIPGVIVTGSFNASGLVKNSDLVNSSTTVNGQTCVLGGTCTISTSAGTITVGTTAVAGGGSNALLYRDSGGLLASATTLPTSNIPAFTGDVTNSAGSAALTIAANAVTNSKLASSPAATIKGNPSASGSTAQDFTIQGLTNLSSPNPTLDFIPIWDNSTGTIKRVTPQSIAGSSGGTVTNVATNGCITGGPITVTGTIGFNQTLCANLPMNYYTTGGTANDTTGVQAALDTCTTFSACVITCTTGAVYRVNTLSVRSNTTLQGCNFQQITSGIEIIAAVGVSNIKLVRNTYTGNTVTSGLAAAVSQDRAIVIQNSNRVWVQDSYFTKFGLQNYEAINSDYLWYTGNYSFGVALGPKWDCSRQIHIEGNTLNQTALYSNTPTESQFAIGFFLSSTAERNCGVSKYVTMVNNIVKDFPYSQAYEIHAGQFVTIANNVADNISICVSANPFNATDLIDHIAITGNTCQANVVIPVPTSSNGGIVVSGIPGVATVTYVSITGNNLNAFNRAFKDNAVGCISLQTVNIVTISGNAMNGCGSNAMAVNTGTTAMAVTGNVFDTTVANGGVSNGILLNASNITGIISGNMFTNQSVNVNNSGSAANTKFTALNNCTGVTTCN